MKSRYTNFMSIEKSDMIRIIFRDFQKTSELEGSKIVANIVMTLENAKALNETLTKVLAQSAP